MHVLDSQEIVDQLSALHPDAACAVREVLQQLRTLGGEARRYNPGEVIFKAEKAAKELLVVVRGRVQAKTTCGVGEPVLVQSAGPGDFVGLSLVDETLDANPYDVVAAEASDVVVLSVKKMIAWMSQPSSLPFLNATARLSFKQLDELRAREVVISEQTIVERLRRYVSIRMQRERTCELAVPGDEQTLADYLCVNKCSLSRTMGPLRDAGKILYKHKTLKVLSRESF